MKSEIAAARAIFDSVDFAAWAMDKAGVVTLSEGRGLRSFGLVNFGR